LASQATPFDLPPTGMTVYVPNVTADGFAMAVQTENEALATSSTTAGYIEVPVLTIAGSVKTSQQLFDRIGPGLTFDMFVARQAAIQAATVLDQQAIAVVVAVAGTITNPGSPSVSAFFEDVARAAASITTENGTVLPATHVFIPSLNMKWLQAQVGTDGRPVWLPSPAGTVARAGMVGSRDEGATGYTVLGADVYEDNSLPTTGPSASYATMLVGDVPDALWVGTSELQVDVWPETDAASLSVVVNARQYAAIACLFPSAFVAVSGAAYVTPTFTGS
jgi:HK97 family phage major capsid protein